MSYQSYQAKIFLEDNYKFVPEDHLLHYRTILFLNSLVLNRFADAREHKKLLGARNAVWNSVALGFTRRKNVIESWIEYNETFRKKITWQTHSRQAPLQTEMELGDLTVVLPCYRKSIWETEKPIFGPYWFSANICCDLKAVVWHHQLPSWRQLRHVKLFPRHDKNFDKLFPIRTSVE